MKFISTHTAPGGLGKPPLKVNVYRAPDGAYYVATCDHMFSLADMAGLIQTMEQAERDCEQDAQAHWGAA